MKLFFNNFLIFLFLICGQALGEDIKKNFTVKVSGIKIGKLNWVIRIDDDHYLTELKLKSQGILSGLYQFEGDYFSEGIVDNNKLQPKKYRHLWRTKKTTKKMFLVFEEDKLKQLDQTPAEKEELRINVFNIKKTRDPLTSFLQIILGDKNSLVVDGRRMYVMNSTFDEKYKKTNIEISDYFNLWADHKRSKFEKLTFEKKMGDFFPSKIDIHFDGRVFKLEQI